MTGSSTSLFKAPVLVPSNDKEHLLPYIMAIAQVVNSMLVVERHEKGHAHPVQRPVYFVSKVLTDAKTRYP